MKNHSCLLIFLLIGSLFAVPSNYDTLLSFFNEALQDIDPTFNTPFHAVSTRSLPTSLKQSLSSGFKTTFTQKQYKNAVAKIQAQSSTLLTISDRYFEEVAANYRDFKSYQQGTDTLEIFFTGRPYEKGYNVTQLYDDLSIIYTYMQSLTSTWNLTMLSIAETLYKGSPMKIYRLKDEGSFSKAKKVLQDYKNSTLSQKLRFTQSSLPFAFSNLTIPAGIIDFVGSDLTFGVDKIVTLSSSRPTLSPSFKKLPVLPLWYEIIEIDPLPLMGAPYDMTLIFNILGLPTDFPETTINPIFNTTFATSQLGPLVEMVNQLVVLSPIPETRYIQNLQCGTQAFLPSVEYSMITFLSKFMDYSSVQSYFFTGNGCLFSPVINLNILTPLLMLFDNVDNFQLESVYKLIENYIVIDGAFPAICPPGLEMPSLLQQTLTQTPTHGGSRTSHYLNYYGFVGLGPNQESLESATFPDYLDHFAANFKSLFLTKLPGKPTLPQFNTSSFSTTLWNSYYELAQRGTTYPSLGYSIKTLLNLLTQLQTQYSVIQAQLFDSYFYLRRRFFYLITAPTPQSFPVSYNLNDQSLTQYIKEMQGPIKVCESAFNASICNPILPYPPHPVSFYYDNRNDQLYGVQPFVLNRFWIPRRDLVPLNLTNITIPIQGQLLPFAPTRPNNTIFYESPVTLTPQNGAQFCAPGVVYESATFHLPEITKNLTKLVEKAFPEMCARLQSSANLSTLLPQYTLTVDNVDDLNKIVNETSKILSKYGLQKSIYRYTNNTYASPFFNPFNLAAYLAEDSGKIVYFNASIVAKDSSFTANYTAQQSLVLENSLPIFLTCNPSELIGQGFNNNTIPLFLNEGPKSSDGGFNPSNPSTVKKSASSLVKHTIYDSYGSYSSTIALLVVTFIFCLVTVSGAFALFYHLKTKYTLEIISDDL